MEVILVLAAALLLLSLACYLWITNEISLKRSTRANELIKEAVKLGDQIAAWLKNNVKDGCSIAVLNDPELLSLFKKDQELYDRICELDPGWKDKITSPVETHKYLIELARGQYRITH